MKRQLRETVIYEHCLITQSMTLPCYGGPYDGEYRAVSLGECFNDLVPVGNHGVAICEIYRTAWRWTSKKGYQGIVLVWVNQ